ncbi:DNA polymerase III subunit alpha [Bombilactobacillus folatiphilus]|uniref:DNA-directed DNA polymerase n=1 Tax=Bombilactobacillus folatiphilus TaxID=2923362 RepID=A0ABY4PAU5_9LACO|nr:DNA polymerase III subunit alpha [Bombilactobacillus folatiphilus]UQS82766.1 DNA polymerase III subunit alpha [Bombilactobacillus folatiphilus]
MTVQLQVLSSYSLLQSTIRLPQLVQQASQMGYKFIALTDVNVTYGLVDFYKLACKAQLRPLLGMTLQIPGILDLENEYQLLVIAKTQQGYHNLLQLSTLIQTQQEPFILNEHADLFKDTALIIPAGQSELTSLLQQEKGQLVPQFLRQLQQLPTHDLYLGLDMRNMTVSQLQLRLRLSELQKIKCVLLDDVQYLNANDAFAQKILHHVSTGQKLTDTDVQGQHDLRSASQVAKQAQQLDLKKAFVNTQKLAQNCNVELEFKRTQLPQFVTPNQESSEQYLTSLTQKGLKRYLPNGIPDQYQQRLQHELQVINQMGYADYFLIVWDVVNQAHHLNILTGPGRGSAAGSLVSFVLGITQIDPLKYDLLFERFLNPERVDMPDIDLDIPDNRRGELVQYMHQKYGAQHMAQIITFGTFAAKQALRDVGSVMGLSQIELKQWSSSIPTQLGMKLQDAYRQSRQLQTLVQKNQHNRLIFDTAIQIEGLPRHFSTHAAGVVLSASDLTQTVALQAGGSENIWLTQQTKNNVEALGLLKIDFLGLRNLTILAQALKLVQQHTGTELKITQIPLDDPQTLRIFSRGATDGIFQFESPGIREVLKQLKPDNFHDIVATNALYRPGPMQNIPHFIARKHHQEPVVYPDDSLKKILQPTYGILVYQEQVMQVVAQMAGFSLAQADLLRRAIAKKDKQIMDQQRQQFIDNSLQRGHQLSNSQQVFDYIEKFANYGFNKAHAVAYSQLAYSLAYLKVYYPQSFFTALLNNLRNEAKLSTYFQDLKHRGIKVLLPDINCSQGMFTIEGANVRFGFSFIKHLRRDLIQDILRQRQRGPFKSLTNFIQRIDERFQTVDDILPLIYSGCFDNLTSNRRQLVEQLDDLIQRIKFAKGSQSIFDTLKPKQQLIEDFSNLEKLKYEQKYLSSYISGHPVDKYSSLKWLYPIQSINQIQSQQRPLILYFVKKIRVIRTKKGQQMAFLMGGDQQKDISVTVFPDLYQKTKLQENSVYLMQVRTNRNKQNEFELVAITIQPARSLMTQVPKHQLFIRFPHKKNELMEKLMILTQKFPGSTPIIVLFSENNEKILLKKNNWLNYNQQSKQSLLQLVGEGNFVYQ